MTSYIQATIDMGTIARQIDDNGLSELMNELGVQNSAVNGNVLDWDMLDSEGAKFIERLYDELNRLKGADL